MNTTPVDTFIKFTKDNPVIIPLLSAILGGTIVSIFNATNAWIQEFYKRRIAFVEANRIVLSQISNAWFILKRINILPHLKYLDAEMNKAFTSIQIAEINNEIRDIYEFMTNKHQIEELETSHKICEENVNQLEKYNFMLAYRLRGAHHDVIKCYEKAQWFYGEFLGSNAAFNLRLYRLMESMEKLKFEDELDQLQSLARDASFKFINLDSVHIHRYFTKKTKSLDEYYKAAFHIPERFIVTRVLRKIVEFCRSTFSKRGKTKKRGIFVAIRKFFRMLPHAWNFVFRNNK